MDGETVFPEAFEIGKEKFSLSPRIKDVVNVGFAYGPEESIQDTLNHSHDVLSLWSSLGADTIHMDAVMTRHWSSIGICGGYP